MPELTERQRTILLLLIRDYIETAQPVGSKRLVERFRLDLSPATVRNEMSALTEMGYLRQPHSGCISTGASITRRIACDRTARGNDPLQTY